MMVARELREEETVLKYARKLLKNVSDKYEASSRVFDAKMSKVEKLNRARRPMEPYEQLNFITKAAELLSAARIDMLEAEVDAAACKVACQKSQIKLLELQNARLRRLLRARPGVRRKGA